MSIGAWLALLFAGLWIGSVVGLITDFAIGIEAVGLALVLVVVLIIISLAFRSMRAASGMLVVLFIVGGFALATALALN